MAVLAVLVYHSGWLVGGWLGVDVFFALSGFLITTLLLEEHAATGTISFRRFYVRRALRLLPPLLALIIILVVVLLATVPAEQRVYLAIYVGAVLLYVANWIEPLGVPLGWGFGHIWSLSIEEQFYLLWPLMLLGLLRLGQRRAAAVVGSAVVAAVVYRLVLVHNGAWLIRVSEGTDTHADPLLIGCTLALVVRGDLLPHSRTLQQLLHGLAACALIGLGILFMIAHNPVDYAERSAGTVAALCTGLLVVSLWLPDAPIRPLLVNRLLVATGRVSYGLYLWHYPIFFALGVNAYGPRSPMLTIAAAWTGALGATLASFYFIERPALQLKKQFAIAHPGSTGSHVDNRWPSTYQSQDGPVPKVG